MSVYRSKLFRFCLWLISTTEEMEGGDELCRWRNHSRWWKKNVSFICRRIKYGTPSICWRICVQTHVFRIKWGVKARFEREIVVFPFSLWICTGLCSLKQDASRYDILVGECIRAHDECVHSAPFCMTFTCYGYWHTCFAYQRLSRTTILPN